jgi:hypothetical protein
VRTATVTALRDSLVLRLGRAEFEELSSKNPSIWHTLTVTLARRVADTNITRAPPPDPRPRTITLIRAGSSELPAGFIVGLTRVFRRSNHTMLVWPEMARTVLACVGPHRQHRGDTGAQCPRGQVRLRAVRGRAGADALVGEGDPASRPRARHRHACGQRAA